MKKLLIIQFIIIIGLVIFLLGMKGCKDRKIAENQSTIDSLTLANQTLQTIKNELEQTVTTQEVIQTTNQEEIQRLTQEKFNLKKQNERQVREVIAYYKGIISTTLKDIDVPFIDTTNSAPELENAECEVALEYYKSHAILVPKFVSDSNKNYQVDMTVTKQGVTINQLVVPDSQYVRFVELKGGFLKKDQQGKRRVFLKRSVQVQVLHTSPFVQVTGGNSIIYTPPKKGRWLEKAILIGGGIYLGSKL